MIGNGEEEVQGIPADHSNMTKFASASDIGFKRVSAQIRRWIEELRAGKQNTHDSRALGKTRPHVQSLMKTQRP